MTITLDRDTIEIGETVILRITGEAKDISSLAELPNIQGIVATMGVKSWSMNNSDGKVKFNQTFLLAPYKAGTFVIGPAWIQSGSNRIFSNKLTLVATPSNRPANQIFMMCVPDKKKAVVGEQITLSILVYSRGKVDIGAERPFTSAFKGFWYKSGDYPVPYPDSSIHGNGIDYRIKTVYKEYVFPNSTGKLKIPPYLYTCLLYQVPIPTGDPFTDELMGIPVSIDLISNEVPIEVVALPEINKPDNFAGDVGEFALNATLEKENIKVNEAVKLTVTITGKGNASFIQLPAINFPAGIESYTPVTNSSTTIVNDVLEGEKTFTITLIPKKEGNYSLPGVSFSYYDPQKKEYVTIQTPEFKLKVAPGDPEKEITENNLPGTFPGGPGYGKTIRRILWILVPAILLMLLYYYQSGKKKKEKSADESNAAAEVAVHTHESLKSKPDIYSMLSLAERLVMAGRIQSGIAQLYETLLTAVLYKTELAREEASIHQLRYRLGIKNFPADRTNETILALEELAAQRYNNWEVDLSKVANSIQKTRKLALELIS